VYYVLLPPGIVNDNNCVTGSSQCLHTPAVSNVDSAQ